MSIFGTGNPNARIMIVGEHFTETEHLSGEPFLAQNGTNLNDILTKSGIMRGDCYCTNLFNAYPPYGNLEALFAKSAKTRKDHFIFYRGIFVDPQIKENVERLQKEINLIKPRVILCFGERPLHLLTGAQGILKWRGSLLELADNTRIQVIPTLSLKTLAYNLKDKFLIIHDCKKAAHISKQTGLADPPGKDWHFSIRPSFVSVRNIIESLILDLNSGDSIWIDFDLETRAGHIACAGLSWSLTDALCIPFMCVENFQGYWSEEEEAHIIHTLYKLLTHPNVKVRGQNLLYDCQYTYRHWHFVPRVVQDTMISHHTCFPGLPNNLGFLASLYCDKHVYWKDDGKTWTKDVGEDQLWRYNCVDCIRTRECGEVELNNLAKMGLETVDSFQQKLFWPVLRAMQLGVRIDLETRARIAKELKQGAKETEQWFETVLGHPFNCRSSKQMRALFYDDLGNKKVMTRATKTTPSRVTCDEEALKTITSREPLMKPFADTITRYRTLGVLLSTFIEAKLDQDQRMRCSYNVCGTETYRFSSSKNAFDSGTNLQNIPRDIEGLPSIKKLFIPDEGYTFFDSDLDRADLQVVAWESEEESLQQALLKNVDLHLWHAALIFNYDVDMDCLIEGTDTCEEYKSRWKKERHFAKTFTHACNYGASPRTLAIGANCTIKEAERAQQSYFGSYKGIKKWHERVKEQLRTTHSVQNILGYKRLYFENPDDILPEALAWVPQSTVACVINRIWVKLYEQAPDIQVLLQVHDSLAGQFPSHSPDYYTQLIKEIGKIELPYPKPLIIPLGVKTSTKSWGDCT